MRPIDIVVERFPENPDAVRRLYLRDEQFRTICEEFALSVAALRHFETRPDAHLRPEVDDYRVLLRELEVELRRHVDTARTD